MCRSYSYLWINCGHSTFDRDNRRKVLDPSSESTPDSERQMAKVTGSFFDPDDQTPNVCRKNHEGQTIPNFSTIVPRLCPPCEKKITRPLDEEEANWNKKNFMKNKRKEDREHIDHYGPPNSTGPFIEEVIQELKVHIVQEVPEKLELDDLVTLSKLIRDWDIWTRQVGHPSSSALIELLTLRITLTNIPIEVFRNFDHQELLERESDFRKIVQTFKTSVRSLDRWTNTYLHERWGHYKDLQLYLQERDNDFPHARPLYFADDAHLKRGNDRTAQQLIAMMTPLLPDHMLFDSDCIVCTETFGVVGASGMPAEYGGSLPCNDSHIMGIENCGIKYFITDMNNNCPVCRTDFTVKPGVVVVSYHGEGVTRDRPTDEQLITTGVWAYYHQNVEGPPALPLGVELIEID